MGSLMGRLACGSLMLGAALGTAAWLYTKKKFTGPAQNSIPLDMNQESNPQDMNEESNPQEQYLEAIPQELFWEILKKLSLVQKWRLASSNLALWHFLIEIDLLPAYSMEWQRNVSLKSTHGNYLLFYKVTGAAIFRVYVVEEESFPQLQHGEEIPINEAWIENWNEVWTANWVEMPEGHLSVTIQVPGGNGNAAFNHTIQIGGEFQQLVQQPVQQPVGLAILLH